MNITLDKIQAALLMNGVIILMGIYSDILSYQFSTNQATSIYI